MFTNYLHRKFQIRSSYCSLVRILKQKAQYTSHTATIHYTTFHKAITLINAKYFLRFIAMFHFITIQNDITVARTSLYPASAVLLRYYWFWRYEI